MAGTGVYEMDFVQLVTDSHSGSDHCVSQGLIMVWWCIILCEMEDRLGSLASCCRFGGKCFRYVLWGGFLATSYQLQ